MSQFYKKSTNESSPNDPITNRFRGLLSLSSNDAEKKKKKHPPDSREVDLGSPVSPLITQNAITSSSSSSSSGSISAGKTTSSRPGHRRSSSAGAPLIYSGSSFASSNSNGATSNSLSNLLPSGNICPSGKILKPGRPAANKTDTLGTGTGHYGHGSIIRGGAKSGSGSGGGGSDPEELKMAGNEMYKRGNFLEALALYDKAIILSPENAAYRSNRAAALTAMGRLDWAVRECEEAVRVDPTYSRAHQRLASLYLRLGQAENARRHLCFPGQQPDLTELQKLQSLEKHLNRCADARKIGDWKSALREIEAAFTIGANSSPQLVACKAEAFLKLQQLEEADSAISGVPKFEHYNSQTKFFGMVAEAYVLHVQAQIDMALGRFENAVAAAEKARQIDYSNAEIAHVLNNVKMVARARTNGNDLFSCGKYAEAGVAYGEGLKHDASNFILYCNRAICWSKLGLWEKSIGDCNQALRIQPNYTKALFRRATSNGKLGRWAEAVKDYEVLRKELPGDNEVLESLHRAQIQLKISRGEVQNMKFGSEVEEVSSLDKFKSVISSPGVSVVHFKAASNENCEDMSPFINMLCVRYPSVRFFKGLIDNKMKLKSTMAVVCMLWNFLIDTRLVINQLLIFLLKVDVEENIAVVKAESIRTVPTFKIYKNGDKVKEIVGPSHQFLEDSVRSYSL